MGPMWKGPAAISRMISTLLVIFTYSSGMPVLYVIGILFFTLTYFVKKVVLFKYYQKSLTIDRLLPLQVTQMFNTALFLHLAFGCFMITNHMLYSTNDGPTDELFIMPTNPVNNAKTEIENLIGSISQTSGSTLG